MRIKLGKLDLASERDYVLVIVIYRYVSAGIRFNNHIKRIRKKQTHLIKYIHVILVLPLNVVERWDRFSQHFTSSQTAKTWWYCSYKHNSFRHPNISRSRRGRTQNNILYYRCLRALKGSKHRRSNSQTVHKDPAISRLFFKLSREGTSRPFRGEFAYQQPNTDLHY